jgi:phage/plasmid-like protein (TIGR03299 family)
MSHDLTTTDHMFSAGGITPWHGLGTVVAGKVDSITSAIGLARLGWRVDLRPVSTQVNGVTVPCDMARAVVRDDTGDVLGVVGTGFVPVQNEGAFAAFQPWIDSGVLTLETAGSLQGGRRVWILARVNVDAMEIGAGDSIVPYALLAHAHDGTMAIRVKATTVRVVCRNTLHASGIMGAVHASIRHTSGAAAKMENAIATLDNVRKAADAQAAAFRSLTTVHLPDGDRERADAVIDYLAAVWNKEATELAKDKRAIDVWDLFEGVGQGSRLATSEGTVWGLYNALSEYVTHTARSRGGNEGRAASTVWGSKAGTLRRGIAIAAAMGQGTAPGTLVNVPTSDIEATIHASFGGTLAD